MNLGMSLHNVWATIRLNIWYKMVQMITQVYQKEGFLASIANQLVSAVSAYQYAGYTGEDVPKNI